MDKVTDTPTLTREQQAFVKLASAITALASRSVSVIGTTNAQWVADKCAEALDLMEVPDGI